MARGGARPGSGRKRGSLSQAKLDIREACLPYAKDALDTLVKICRDKNARASDRLSAANSLLDRAFGRPIQSHRVGGLNGGPLELISATMDPKQAEELYSRTLRGQEE